MQHPTGALAPHPPEMLTEQVRRINGGKVFQGCDALQHLLSYLADCATQGQPGKAREIATAVFGRAPDFDSHNDSVVRVHASRLRSKLAEYYVQEGSEDPLLITVPKGSYDLSWSFRTGPEHKPGRRWTYWAVAGGSCLLLVAVVLLLVRMLVRRSAAEVPPREVFAAAPVTPPPAGPAIRLLAGYSGQPHSDPAGNIWQPDAWFQGGGGADLNDNRTWTGLVPTVARTNDEFLFRHLRSGEFSYHIPLAPGVYELRLYFAEPFYGPGLGGGEASRVFNVRVNDSPLLPGFDVEADAMGPSISDERIFRDISPAADGKLHITFESLINKPLLNAIEIVPGLPHRQLPIRLTAQSGVYIGRDGSIWSPDNYFYNGQRSIRPARVNGADDPGLFTVERFGHFNYAIPADPRDRYTVALYFAEYYWGVDGRPGPGARRFNVYCNGETLLRDFDIFREAGNLHGISRAFRHLRPTAQGKFDLTFEPITNNATVSAIEVLDESQ